MNDAIRQRFNNLTRAEKGDRLRELRKKLGLETPTALHTGEPVPENTLDEMEEYHELTKMLDDSANNEFRTAQQLRRNTR